MESGAPLTYDQFVKRVVCEVAPLFPGALSPEVEFAGSDVPDADAALLHCGRALALEALARMTAHFTRADVHEYAHERTLIRKEPVLLHAAYARNIRRWERGTLPRKRKARTDFVLVAVCWLYAWGDAECAFDDAHRAARERVVGWLAIDDRSAGRGMVALASELWHASSLVYRASLDARTDRGGISDPKDGSRRGLLHDLPKGDTPLAESRPMAPGRDADFPLREYPLLEDLHRIDVLDSS